MRAKNNILITMSGGTTTVINSTLAGIIETAQKNSAIGKIYAGCPGIIGVLKENIIDLTDINGYELSKLKRTPGSAFVGTTRVAMLNAWELQKIEEVFGKYNISYFINIGGNGTIKQTKAISAYFQDKIKTAAVPKTVDNDLGDSEFIKVFFTPGFPSCVNYWSKKLQLLNLDNFGACSHDKVLIAQTFGRETGFIAGSARVSDPNRTLPLIILIPEEQQDINAVLGRIERDLRVHNRSLVVLSEGYKIGEIGKAYDPVGQVMYGSSQSTSAQMLVNACMAGGIQARSYIPTVDQRMAIDDILNFDNNIAFQLGVFTVEQLVRGNTDFLSSIADTNMVESLISIPFDEINDYSRIMPDQWIAKGEFDVKDEYVKYLRSFFKYSKFEKNFENYENRFALRRTK